MVKIFTIENDGEFVNVRKEAIRLGWVTVNVREKDGMEEKLLKKEFEKNLSVIEYRELKNLEGLAVKEGAGVHTTSKTKRQASLRHVHRHSFKDKTKMAWELFEKIKNYPHQGVVEQVRNGSTLRIIILDRMDEITVMLAGIKCPDYNFIDKKKLKNLD